jgi:putative intracellular protease/amidase
MGIFTINWMVSAWACSLYYSMALDFLTALTPYKVFSAIGMYIRGVDTVDLISTKGERSVPSGVNRLALEAQTALDPIRSGIILVPGSLGKPAEIKDYAIPNTLWQAKETGLPDLMKQAYKNKEIVEAAVCGGSLLLAMEGLLKDRHAVTNHIGLAVLERPVHFL